MIPKVVASEIGWAQTLMIFAWKFIEAAVYLTAAELDD